LTAPILRHPHLLPAFPLRQQLLPAHRNLVRRLTDSVLESLGGASPGHFVLYGPPGSGKSHVAAAIAERLGRAAEREQGVLVLRSPPAGLGVRSVLDLLDALLREADRRMDPAARARSRARIFDLPAGAAEAAAWRVLATLGATAERHVLLILDRYDVMAARWGAARVRFEEALGTAPSVAVLATTSSPFDDEGRPWLGGGADDVFAASTPELEIDEIVAAARADRGSAAKHAPSAFGPEAEASLRAAVTVLGRAARVVAALRTSGIASADGEPERRLALRVAVDALSAGIEDQLDVLSAQQVRLLCELAEWDGASTVGEVARHTFCSSQTAASQLGLLKSRGLVRSERSGRRSFYEISDPALSIWLETMRRGPKSFEALVSFMRAWFLRATRSARPPAVETAVAALMQPGQEGAWREVVRELADRAEEERAWDDLAVALVVNAHRLAPGGPLADSAGLWRDLWWEWALAAERMSVALRIVDAAAQLGRGSTSRPTLLRLRPAERRLLAQVLRGETR
jgi:DNA-binding MarR family transcriptional regulator